MGRLLDEYVDVTRPDAAIDSLVADVRRALWRGHLQRAVRAALWAWAVVMIAGAIMHALVGRPGAMTLLVVGTATWLIALAATALRRPTIGTAALHADRRLGGQSALSTWLEARGGQSARLETAAGKRLLEWTTAAVPLIRDALKIQRTSWQLLRPAAAAAICTVIAVAVMTLGNFRTPAASVRDESVDAGHASTEAPLLDESALAERIATELATADIRADAANERPDAEPPDRRDAASSAPGGAEPAAGDSASTLRREPGGVSAAPGSGREAGDTRDDSAPGATSRAAAGPLLVKRRDVSGQAVEAQRLADDEHVASYVDEPAAVRGPASKVDAGAAAARPPAARREASLSPAEVAYMANWRAGSRAVTEEQQ
jgi:hypothetical protein